MRRARNRSKTQRGAALVIAIFSLMLISVVATALILTAGTQSAIKTNYKSAMHAFYDAKAGLEEARGRLWTNNNDAGALLNCVFPGGAPMSSTNVCYITNGANVDPRDPNNLYADTEYSKEWGTTIPASAQLLPSTSATASIAGPLYKWVRITARTERSANIDTDADGIIDITPLYFDGQSAVDSGKGLPAGAAQILTITSFAVTPNNSQRMVQYTVAPASFLEAFSTFPSALTLDGTGVSFIGPGSSGGATKGSGSTTFQINGNDVDAPPGTPSGVTAIGYTNSSDGTGVSNAATPSADYLSPQSPSVGPVSLPTLLQTPSGLQGLVQSITQNADLVLTPNSGSVDQSSLPSTMSAQNPMIVVVNGDLHLTHASGKTPFTGYGLLVVTGTLYYDPDDSWYGVILVIGKGVFNGSQNGKGGQITGTVFVADTIDRSTGSLLDTLGPASFALTGGGNGIRYSSSAIKLSQPSLPYQVLSFREIDQTP